MSTAKDIYDILFAEPGKKVSVAVGSTQEAESLRTSLHRLHKLMTDMDLSTDSLCMSMSKLGDQSVASFWLGTPRNRLPRQYFILDLPDHGNKDASKTPTLLGFVEDDRQQYERSAGEGNLSAFLSENSDSGSPQGEE